MYASPLFQQPCRSSCSWYLRRRRALPALASSPQESSSCLWLWSILWSKLPTLPDTTEVTTSTACMRTNREAAACPSQGPASWGWAWTSRGFTAASLTFSIRSRTNRAAAGGSRSSMSSSTLPLRGSRDTSTTTSATIVGAVFPECTGLCPPSRLYYRPRLNPGMGSTTKWGVFSHGSQGFLLKTRLSCDCTPGKRRNFKFIDPTFSFVWDHLFWYLYCAQM